MSQENLEIVRSMYAAWERGDFSWTGWAHPEIHYVIADGPAPGNWTGLTDAAKGFREFLSAWEEHRIEVDEYRELEPERFLVLTHYTGRGRTSGLELGEMRTKVAHVVELDGGKVTRFVAYFDHKRALADLGLTE